MTDERTEEQILAGIRETRNDREKNLTLDLALYEGTVGYSPNEGNKKLFGMNRQTMSRKMTAKMLRAVADEIDAPAGITGTHLNSGTITINGMNGGGGGTSYR